MVTRRFDRGGWGQGSLTVCQVQVTVIMVVGWLRLSFLFSNLHERRHSVPARERTEEMTHPARATFNEVASNVPIPRRAGRPVIFVTLLANVVYETVSERIDIRVTSRTTKNHESTEKAE